VGINTHVAMRWFFRRRVGHSQNVRQTRMTFEIGYSRDIQNTNTKEKRTIQSNSKLVLHKENNVRETASQYYFRFRLSTRPKSIGQTIICPSESIAMFQHFKRWPTSFRRALRPAKTASQYYFRFRVGSAPNLTRPKSTGILT